MSTMTAPPPTRPPLGPAAVVLLVMGVATLAVAVVLLLRGAVGNDHSELCGPGDDPDLCVLDSAGNQRQQDLVFTAGLATGLGGLVLLGGAGATGVAARRR